MNSKVSIQRAGGYDALRSHIEKLIDDLGGWRAHVRPGDSVLLKVNLLLARDPERGATTHPAVVKAVAESLLDYGASVAIGDSPGTADKGVERVFRNTGMIDVAESLGIPWVRFETAGTRTIPIDDKLTLQITRAIDGFDRIVSLPKLKTHSFMLYTGAVKNLFGLVPGFQKAGFHKLLPRPSEFSRMLIAIYERVPVALHIMDAIVGMEGNGPSSGELRDVGLLLASTDGVAMDTVAAHIIGIKPNRVITTKLAQKAGLGQGDLSKIEIPGGELSDFILEKPFKLPPMIPDRLVPTWLVRYLGRLIWIRPVPIEDKCVRCGICAKHCPVDAITMRGERLPEFDYKACITCLCCHELCPEDAIELDRSWIAKRIG